MSTASASRQGNKRKEETMSTAIERRMPPAGNDLMDHLKTWAHDNPQAAALCCFAVGFIAGWKLKPW